jgi:hypothetical protein
MRTYNLMHWTGSVGGTRFRLRILYAESLRPLPKAGSHREPAFRVEGTLGDQKVAAVVSADLQTRQLVFTGSVGNLSFSGTLQRPAASNGATRAGAAFTVRS